MNVLIACEESQRVCNAFREKGHNAFSCDIIDCSGGHPEWHIKHDVLPLLNGSCVFTTCDGKEHSIPGKWDLIIAHPPCTYLCLSGQRWCDVNRYGERALKRLELRDEAFSFFMAIANADCDKIAIENPVGIMSRFYKPASQYIHPYEFGHGTGKKTGLWLKGLPKLKPTKIVPIEYVYSGTGRRWDAWFWKTSCIYPASEKSRVRSLTFEGIAQAMSEQWG